MKIITTLQQDMDELSNDMNRQDAEIKANELIEMFTGLTPNDCSYEFKMHIGKVGAIKCCDEIIKEMKDIGELSMEYKIVFWQEVLSILKSK